MRLISYLLTQVLLRVGEVIVTGVDGKVYWSQSSKVRMLILKLLFRLSPRLILKLAHVNVKNDYYTIDTSVPSTNSTVLWQSLCLDYLPVVTTAISMRLYVLGVIYKPWNLLSYTNMAYNGHYSLDPDIVLRELAINLGNIRTSSIRDWTPLLGDSIPRRGYIQTLSQMVARLNVIHGSRLNKAVQGINCWIVRDPHILKGFNRLEKFIPKDKFKVFPILWDLSFRNGNRAFEDNYNYHVGIFHANSSDVAFRRAIQEISLDDLVDSDGSKTLN